MILFNFLKYLFLNIKYTKLLKSIYKDENLIEKFSQLFGVEFRIDWIGRVYAVLNPNIINDKLDVNTQIFEYTETGLSNSVYLERWIMTKFNLVKDFIMANNLFDLLTYEIKRLDEYDNYLFVIKPITLYDCIKWSKIFSIIYGLIILISMLFFIVIL